MSRSRLIPLIGTGAALCILGLVAACEQKPPGDGTPDTTVVTPDDTIFDKPVRRPAVPALDTNPTLSAGLPVMGWNKRRIGRDCPNCQVTVWVGAYDNAVPPDTTNPPTEPYTLALVINRSFRRADMYGFQTLTPYNLVYQKDSTGRAGFKFRGVLGEVGEEAVGNVTMCPRKDHKHEKLDVGFRSCDGMIAVVPKASILGPALARLLRFFDSAARQPRPDEDPAWWSCGSGCCVAKAVYPS